MAGVEKFYDNNGQSGSAAQKRAVQLRDWEKSATNKQPSTIVPSRQKPKIKFADSVVFLAAADSGDTVEVEKLVLNEGADVNAVNKDGLTALHQCCIDDDFDMVKTLVRLGANVDQQDKEGWTPLHAAASCGHTHIVSFLLEHGAFPALVNNEGDTPLDVAEDSEEIIELLQERIDRDLIDMEAVRGVEEAMMLEDANRLKNDHTLKPIVSHGGATPLHVAAAKNYLQVMKILLSLKASQVQVDAEDEDGWTSLHAAVYWGNFEAAEMLVTHGAQIDKKTYLGESIEDLCEPELEEELDTLKRYQNNRQRSNAMSQKPRQLLHSNSREDINKQHSSPQIVRRRSSKERSMFPKMDIAKEREEREIFAAETGDYSTSSSGSPPTVHVTGESNSPSNKSSLKVNQNVISKHTTSEAREYIQDSSNSSKDAQSSDKANSQGVDSPGSRSSQVVESQGLKSSKLESDSAGSPNLSPSESPQGSPPQKAKAGSPKTAKKKLGMSPRMMQRVGQWESQTTISTPPPSSSSSNSSPSSRSMSSSGRGPLPIASSTPSSNSTSLQSSSNGEAPSRYSAETKRYSFQPKTISPASSSSSLPPRSMSVDQRNLSINVKSSVHALKKTSLDDRITISSTSAVKRSSYDETANKRILDTPSDNGGYRVSSLPRSAKISREESTSSSTDAADKKAILEPKKEAEASAVATEASATPGAQTDASLGTHETKREQSVDSSTSSRSGLEDSETNRKMRARKSRQNRKQTQPVPVDLMDQITKHKEQDSPNVSGQNTSADAEQESTSDSNPGNSTEENSPAEKRKWSYSSSKVSTESPDVSAGRTSKVKEESEARQVMSSYKPRTRPASRILNAVANAQQQSARESSGNPGPVTVTTSSSSVSAKPKMAEVVDQKMAAEAAIKSQGSATSAPSAQVTSPTNSPSVSSKHMETSGVSTPRSPGEACKPDTNASSPHLLHPRTKSTARRKPREKRRSTGIVADAAEGEEVPEELANLVRKSGDGATSTSFNQDHTPDISIDDENPSPSLKKGDEEELAKLRLLLAEEQSRNQKMERELEEAKSKVLELNRRFEDATRAYEQERRENEVKDARIEELQLSSKTLQDLRHENQRMKDENSALIRVIGKLSRSPLPHHTHT